MVVVDSVDKQAHFSEMLTTVMAARVVNLYLQIVWKLHSLLQKVVSDRGPQFVAVFIKELFRMLGIKAATSTTYHPQTNRQTK